MNGQAESTVIKIGQGEPEWPVFLWRDPKPWLHLPSKAEVETLLPGPMGIQKMKQGELCDRLQVSKMLANRVIKSKSLPEGLKRHQKKGNHYVFNFRQAFWFGIVLKLRQSGVPTGDAEAIANAAKGLFAGLKRGRGWSDPFDPFRGGQHPSAEWTLEVGDLQAVRLATSAASGSQGAPKDLMWHSLDGHDVSEKFKPVVVLRLDLAYLAKLLPKDKTEPLFDL